MRVLVTGSLGSVGEVVCAGLQLLDHDVVGADIAAGADHTLDCTDPEAVDELVRTVRPDAIVHLAGIPNESSLPEALSSHVISTAALLEAMVAHDVRRIVYASSNHAVGRTPAKGRHGEPTRLSTHAEPRPDTFYGVGKVAAEAVLRLYVDRHGIDAIACRIGSFLPRPESRRNLATWLSHADAVRMVAAALSAPAPGFAVLYGISANTRAWWDLDAGRALGYHPEDDAEAWASEIESGPTAFTDRSDSSHVGGPFATPAYERPAF